MKEIKKSILLPLMLLPCVVATTMVAATSQPLHAIAEEVDDYSLIFDKDHHYLNGTTFNEHTDFDMFTMNKHSNKHNDDYELTFFCAGMTDASSNDAFASIAHGGYLMNVTKLPGISNIVVNYSCSSMSRVGITWSWEVSDMGEKGEYYYEGYSKILTFDFLGQTPNHFYVNFDANSTVTVNSITVNYACEYDNNADNYNSFNTHCAVREKDGDRVGVITGLRNGVTVGSTLNLTANPYPSYDLKVVRESAFEYEAGRNNYDLFDEIVFPNSLKEIETKAFKGCGVAYMDFPTELHKVCAEAFANCPNLDSFFVSHSTILDPDAFIGCDVQTIYTDFPVDSQIEAIPWLDYASRWTKSHLTILDEYGEEMITL